MFLRSVSLAMLVVIFAIAFAALDTAAFLGAALTTGLTTGLAAGLVALAGAVIFLVVVAAFGADFFAVAIFNFRLVMTGEEFRQRPIVAKLIALLAAPSRSSRFASCDRSLVTVCSALSKCLYEGLAQWLRGIEMWASCPYILGTYVLRKELL